ncbi:amidase domain-containing protein [Halonatronum saccharophilum]|uniref:amidase domain-containing protein n=1 Tax=Halonatronum saccharophilum TaxID=150060 RepID=UPI00047F445F|nr:amidase domain-containing protein [Halonatronum saccharophilum]
MFILIRLKRKKLIFGLIAFLALGGLGAYFWNTPTEVPVILIDENSKSIFNIRVQEIFDIRNKALLEGNKEILKSLYNRKVRNGVWAYEHDIKKMKYLHSWSIKQGVIFEDINSQVIVRGGRDKGEVTTLNLLVSTEYIYSYKDQPRKYNFFRIGTYHTLDLMEKDDRWIIKKEWYADPFADSLNLNNIKDNELREIIMSKEARDLSDLNERRVNAIAYVDKYSGAANLPEYGFQYNYDYRNYNPLGGDCTNFASQMLYEGGGFRKTGAWNYNRGGATKAWVNAHAFNSFMLGSGRASLIARGSYEDVLKRSYKLLPGDYVAYEKKGRVKHISVVSGLDSKGYPLVNSHNADRHRVPWDLGWSDRGVKFQLIRVHY